MEQIMKEVRCPECGKLFGRNFTGRIEIVCDRTSCKRYNVFDTNRLPYQSHKLLALQKNNDVL